VTEHRTGFTEEVVNAAEAATTIARRVRRALCRTLERGSRYPMKEAAGAIMPIRNTGLHERAVPRPNAWTTARIGRMS